MSNNFSKEFLGSDKVLNELDIKGSEIVFMRDLGSSEGISFHKEKESLYNSEQLRLESKIFLIRFLREAVKHEKFTTEVRIDKDNNAHPFLGLANAKTITESYLTYFTEWQKQNKRRD